MDNTPIVIIGSGLAAWTVARELHKLDAQVPVTLVTRDSGDFYSKPMLSNALGAGKTAAQLVSATSASLAASLGVSVWSQTEVTALDPSAHRIQTSRGPLAYRQLVLALGADPVQLKLAGDAAPQVLSVNDLQDYARFRAALQGAHRVLILGAGLIGCEFANDLLSAGHAVQVVDPGQQPLGRLLPPEAGARVRRGLEAAGVAFEWGVSVQAVHALAGSGVEAELSDGRRVRADLVLSAVGLRPRLSLAQAAGLKTDRAVVVDRGLQTSAPDVFALGDVAEIDGQWRPYVMPLMQAARTLAARLAGQPATLSYPAMPVVVKTPAVPVVVSPPRADVAVKWQVQDSEDGLQAQALDAQGRLAGFALVGAAVAQKSQWQKMVPAWLV